MTPAVKPSPLPESEPLPVGVGRSTTPFLLVLLVPFVAQVSSYWYTTPDSARYLSIARRIAAGEGISDFDSPAPSFPPGYPLVASGAFWWSDHPFLAISLIHLVLVGLLALATHRWMRRRLGGGAFLLTALVMVNASLWHHFRRPLSELAFMAAAMAAVECLHGLRVAAADPRSSKLRLLAAAGLLALLPLIREVGLVFAVAFAVVSAFDSWRSRLPRATPPAVVCGLVLAGVLSAALFLAYDLAAAARSSVPVGRHLGTLIHPPEPRSVWTRPTARYRIGEVGRLLVPGAFRQKPLREWIDRRTVVYGPLAILVTIGWWRLAASGDLLAAAAPLYVVVYLAWGFEAGTRYMLPLLPLLAGALWIALERLGSMRRALFAGLVIAHLLASLYDWRVYDLPLAKTCAGEWPSIEAIAHALPSDATLGLSTEIPDCVGSMLEFDRDRWAPNDHIRPEAAARASWRLELASAVVSPGYEPVSEIGAYRLVRRTGR